MNGTLALVGSGEYLPPMEPVDRLLIERLGQPAKVVCLPTAAGNEGPASTGYWSNLGVTHFTRLGVEVRPVEILNREDAHDEKLVEHIREANFVYFSGGKPDYLYNAIAGTPAFGAVEAVLDSGGIVAGCSAGAMIWGERATPFPWHKGFGYLPGVVVLPHFDEMSGWVVDIVKTVLAHNLTLLGIEGNTALICANGRYTVSGSGGVMAWNHQQKQRYTDGQAVDWLSA
jgi:cyanophycinase-like exopeptidase